MNFLGAKPKKISCFCNCIGHSFEPWLFIIEFPVIQLIFFWLLNWVTISFCIWKAYRLSHSWEFLTLCNFFGVWLSKFFDSYYVCAKLVVDALTQFQPRVAPRAQCGFVGLKNAGATCYMNSVLQQLYMQPGLREVIATLFIPEPLIGKTLCKL